MIIGIRKKFVLTSDTWDNFVPKLIRVMKAAGDFFDGFLNNDAESGQDKLVCAESLNQN